MVPTKTPKHLLSMKTPEEDSLTRIKRRIAAKRKEEKAKAEKDEEPDDMELTVIKKDPFVAKIQRWNIEKIRSTLDDLVAVPGPNAYKFLKTIFGRQDGCGHEPRSYYGAPQEPSKSRQGCGHEQEGEFVRELKFSPPGVGSYNLRGRLDAPSNIPLRGSSPVTKIHPRPSKQP